MTPEQEVCDTRPQDSLLAHCHVNTNEDGDRFVGIRADSHKALVCFPLGYQLPETESEIRADIRHLIQVLSEFTTQEERLLAVNRHGIPQTIDFPIHAYQIFPSAETTMWKQSQPIELPPAENRTGPKLFENKPR